MIKQSPTACPDPQGATWLLSAVPNMIKKFTAAGPAEEDGVVGTADTAACAQSSRMSSLS